MNLVLPLAAISPGAAFWLVVLVGSAIWVGTDASKRDWSNDRFASSPGLWVVGIVLLWIIVLPVYLVKRGKAPLKGSAVPANAGAAPAYSNTAGMSGPSLPPPPPPVVQTGPPANWYPDPRNERRLRWWDGARWTDQTAD